MQIQQIPVSQPLHIKLKLHQLFAIGITLRQKANPHVHCSSLLGEPFDINTCYLQKLF